MNTSEMSVVDNITVVYEDDAIVVINKPAGITVNRADTTRHEVTVQDWAEKHIQAPWTATSDTPAGPNNIVGTRDSFYDRGGIVHRLDKETSGILLLAKTPEAFVELQRQFKERIVKKTYKALTHGKIVPEEGEINVPVGRLPWNRKQFGVVAGGREAVTKYKVTTNYELRSMGEVEKLTLVTLFPETGRTHQIRVHLKYIGFPIFGDFLYAGRKTQRDDRKMLSRVFLHAASLSFLHPTTHEHVQYAAPLAAELQATLDQLIPV